MVATSGPHGWIAISVETVTQWNALASAVDRADLAVDAAADIATMKAREKDMERAVATAFATCDAAEAVGRLQAAHVPAGRVYAGIDLLGDPQLVHDGFWRRAERRFIGNHVVRTHRIYWMGNGRRSITRRRRLASTTPPCFRAISGYLKTNCAGLPTTA